MLICVMIFLFIFGMINLLIPSSYFFENEVSYRQALNRGGSIFVICFMIEMLCCLGLCGINSYSSSEVYKTGEWELVALTDPMHSDNLIYIYLTNNSNEIYTLFNSYKSNLN